MVDLGFSPHFGSQGVTVTRGEALAPGPAKIIQECQREENAIPRCKMLGNRTWDFLVHPASDFKSQKKREIGDVRAADGEMGRLVRK